MKKKYIPLILFISISAVYLISAFTLEVRQKACFLASKQIAPRFISESEEHLSTLDQYYQADPLVSQFEFVTYPLPNGGFKATLQAKELTTIDQLASSSFFTNVANTYAPELTHFLSTLTCKNTGKVSYLHTNFLLGIDIHDQDPWYDYEIDLIYYSDSYRKECNLLLILIQILIFLLVIKYVIKQTYI